MKRTKRYNGEDDSQVSDDTTSDTTADASPASASDKTTAKMPSRPGQTSSGTKTPIITKEQLGGMSLRDYLNKQQGLTRRGDSAPSSMPGGSSAEVNGKRNYRLTPDDPVGTSMKRSLDKQLSDKNKVDLASPITAMRSLSRKFNTDESLPVNERMRNAFGMKKGGATKKMASGGSTSSASSRADGIAQRGKTKGTMC